MPTRILLLEDNKLDADLIRIELKRWSIEHELIITDSKENFIRQLEKDPPDVILSDYNLPQFTAIEALEILGNRIEDIPFIMVTGNLSDSQAVECMNQGAWDYILKDRISRLRSAIDNSLSLLKEKKNKDLARHQLKITEQRFETIFDKAPIGIIIVDVNDYVILANRAFEKTIELSNNQLTGKKFTEYFEKGFINEYKNICNSSTNSWSMEVKLLHPEKQYFIWTVLYVTKVEEDYIDETYYIIHIEDITENKIGEEKLNEAYQQLKYLKNKLKEENLYLREEIKLNHNFDDIITQDNHMLELLKEIEIIAVTDSTTLITGETGTGKELFARAIHDHSNRSDKPFVKINCAAIPAELLESELFGYQKGAFTGANQAKKGKFELAHEGTVFLDEVGELPLSLQPKLLRFMQEGELEKIGATESVKVNVRLIAATNRDLQKEVYQGNFREDLFYRLNIIPILIPPLRKRIDDINLLVIFFINKFNKKFGKKIKKISPTALKELKRYNWPGNVRELENLMERAAILSRTSELSLPEWQKQDILTSVEDQDIVTLDEFEKQYIIQVLEFCNWKVSGKNGAASKLGLKPTTLESRMKKLNIQRP